MKRIRRFEDLWALNAPPFVSPSDLARALNCSTRHVQRLADCGILDARKLPGKGLARYGRWKISLRSAQALASIVSRVETSDQSDQRDPAPSLPA